jgi:hypothetical protein
VTTIEDLESSWMIATVHSQTPFDCHTLSTINIGPEAGLMEKRI